MTGYYYTGYNNYYAIASVIIEYTGSYSILFPFNQQIDWTYTGTEASQKYPFQVSIKSRYYFTKYTQHYIHWKPRNGSVLLLFIALHNSATD